VYRSTRLSEEEEEEADDGRPWGSRQIRPEHTLLIADCVLRPASGHDGGMTVSNGVLVS
jgi:hypothetical protein